MVRLWSLSRSAKTSFQTLEKIDIIISIGIYGIFSHVFQFISSFMFLVLSCPCIVCTSFCSLCGLTFNSYQIILGVYLFPSQHLRRCILFLPTEQQNIIKQRLYAYITIYRTSHNILNKNKGKSSLPLQKYATNS